MNQGNKQELDIIDLLEVMWAWFVRFVCRPVVWLVCFGLRHWWQLLFFGLLGIACSFGYYAFYPDYRGYVIYQNNVESSSDYITEIQRIRPPLPDEMVASMQLPQNSVAEFRAIYPHAIYYLDSLSTVEFVDYHDILQGKSMYKMRTDRFCVEIRTFDRSAFEGWEEGLQRYFSRLPHYSQSYKVKRSDQENKKQALNMETHRLDSLMTQGYVSLVKQEIVPGKEGYAGKSSQSVFQEMLQMKSEAQWINNAMELQSDVLTVVMPLQSEFLAVNHPLFTMTKFFVFFVLLGFLCLLAGGYWKSISAFIRNNK